MKKTTWKALLLTLFAGIGFFSHGQQARVKELVHQCYTDELVQKHLHDDPEAAGRLNFMDESIQFAIRKKIEDAGGNLMEKSGNADLTIPVVVYVVHENGVENISVNQVLSQITALNNYYDAYGIQFCLASMNGSASLASTTVPAGITSPYPGIFNLNSSVLTNHNVSQQAALTAVSGLSSSRYLRIWVVKKISADNLPPGSKINGYSMLPELAPAATDGIVMAYDAFGDIATCGCTALYPQTQNGKILVHEVGHYLGLYHTFQGGCAGMSAANCAAQGDKVCDTPPVAVPNSGCPASMNSCAESPNLPDDIHNYMDYVNETCMTGFTPGQETRMISAISLYRAMLVSGPNHVHTGISCNVSLQAAFTVNNNAPCVGNTVTFTGVTISGATYDWDFGDGTTGSGNPVSHTYSAAYVPANVVLTVHSGSGSVSAVQDLFVTACTPVNNGESQWHFGSKQGLDFSSGVPVYDNAAFVNNTIPPTESCVVQSDAAGNLLFYSDGFSLWNGNHAVVSTSIGGNNSSASGAMSVPHPTNPNQYYLFQTTTAGNATYRIVTSTGGGNVTLGAQLPMPISPLAGSYTSTGEGVTAIASCDGGHWILTKGQRGTSSWNLVVFRLTSLGISYVSEIPIALNTPYTAIEASPNGRKVAVSAFSGNNKLVVLDFDNYTGTLSNQILLTIGTSPWQYGLCFSNDSKLLYTYMEGSTNPISQFNLEDANPAASVRTVGIISLIGNSQNRASMQRGPDNKIYIIRNNMSQLAVIHQPNNLCTAMAPNACNFTNEGPVLLNTTASQSLPNILDAKVATVFPNTLTYDVAGCLAYHFFPNVCGVSFSWNFGDPASGASNTSTQASPWHTFSGPGTYTVTLTSGSTVLTRVVQVGFTPVITGPLTACDNTTSSYSVELAPGQTPYWTVTGGAIAGLNNQGDITVAWTTLPGTVTVQVYDPATECTMTATINVAKCQTACPCTLKPVFTYSLDDKKCVYSFKADAGAKECLQNVRYNWDFGDGTFYVGQYPDHVFPVNGTFVVCLTVTANNGITICQKKICKIIHVDCKKADCDCKLAPKIEKSFDPKECLLTVKGFTGGPECLENVTYFWEFGDGTTSIGQTAGHIYENPGQYEVCLTVKASNGEKYCEEKYCELVDIECGGRCDCKLAPNFKKTGKNCNFTFLGSSGSDCANISAYNWYVNGVGPFTGPVLHYSFDVNTSYEICFEVIAYTALGECKEKVCESYFYTDCYPIIDGPILVPKSMEETTIELYPNPTSGAFSIGLDMLQQGPVHVSIKSLDGKELYSNSWSLETGRQVLDLELPDSVVNGMVLVEINAGGVKTIKKVVVANQ
jgi:PKD repeat protein